MQNYFQKKAKAGFTLIEIIVSLALFSVVVTIAVGALLVLISSNRQLQNEQSVLSNLSFALDSMTREIRTGSNYYCVASNGRGNQVFRDSGNLALTGEAVGDCSNSDPSSPANQAFHGIAFNEGGESVTAGLGSDRIAYFFVDQDGDPDDGKIFRRLNDTEPESIVSDGIHIEDANFFVTGAEDEDVQPKITIVIRAYNSAEDAAEDPTGERAYIIQTTVTQRSLDI